MLTFYNIANIQIARSYGILIKTKSLEHLIVIRNTEYIVHINIFEICYFCEKVHRLIFLSFFGS